MSLSNKFIIVGVTGGIAAYKSAHLVRCLRKKGAEVRVIMTEAAKSFITELTLQALSGRPVLSDMLTPGGGSGIDHIELSGRADAVVVAPATAHTIARMRAGMADDLLTATVLAAACPVFVAPAMNERMLRNPATRENLRVLAERGFRIVGPDTGFQACGATGPGRMAEPEEIAARVESALGPRPLAGVKTVITAGPTVEPIDPVRFIANRSSGKMGYAIAAAAAERGADVTLISGPVSLEPPAGVATIRVETALEMLAAVRERAPGADIFVACAAVADFRPARAAGRKIKKKELSGAPSLELTENPDILAETARGPGRPRLVVGFAAETENVLANAREKLAAKNADVIVANDVTDPDGGFGRDTNSIIFVSRKLPEKSIKNCSKRELGNIIMEFCTAYPREEREDPPGSA